MAQDRATAGENGNEVPSRVADMFVAMDEDARMQVPTTADERATLVGFLAWQR